MEEKKPLYEKRDAIWHPLEVRNVSESFNPEHMIVSTHVVIVIEKLIGVGLVIKEPSQMAHGALDVIELIGYVLSELLFRIPLSDVHSLESVDVELMSAFQIIIESLLRIAVQFGISLDFVECIFTHAALAVQLTREALIILEHQLGIIFILMQLAAHIDELIVAIELREIEPCPENATAIILVVRTAVDRGITLQLGAIGIEDFL